MEKSKNFKIRFSVFAMVMVVAIIILSACGGGAAPVSNTSETAAATTGAPASASETTTAATTEPAADPPKSAEIVYMWWGEDTLSQAEWDEFEQEWGLKVTRMAIPYENYYEKLNTLIAAGETPDIMALSEFLAIEWGEKGVIADLVPVFKDNLDIDLFDEYIPACLYGTEGKVYGLTSGLTCIILFFNKDLYDKYGVEYPSTDPANPMTWAEYVEKTQQLTRDKNDNTPLDAGFDKENINVFGTKTTTWTFAFTALLFSNNTGMFTEDGMALAFDQPEAIEVMSELQKLSIEYQCAPDAIISGALPGNVQMFKDGMLANAIEGSFMLGGYLTEGANFGIAPLPMFATPATATWAACTVIGVDSPYKKEIAPFLYSKTSQTGNQYPSLKKDYEPEAFSKWLEELGLPLEDSSWMGPYINSDASRIHEAVYVMNYGTILDEAINPALSKLWSGEATASEFAADAAERAAGMFQGVFKIFQD